MYGMCNFFSEIRNGKHAPQTALLPVQHLLLRLNGIA